MKKLFILMLLAILAFSACVAEFKETKVPVNTTLPLTNFNISETTLLSWAGMENGIAAGADGVLEVNQSSRMAIGNKEDLKSIFTIADQSFDFPINLGGSIIAPTEITIPSPTQIQESFTFPSDYSITSAHLKSGTLSFTVQNSISDFSNVICTVAQISKNGTPFTLKSGETKSLEGYTLEFKEGSKITFALSGKINAKSGDNLSKLNLAIDFNNLDIAEATGFFGRTIINIPKELVLAIDSEVTGFFSNCKYYLANPSVTLKLNNTHNLPFLLEISKLQIGSNDITLKKGIGDNRILVLPQTTTEYRLSNRSTVSGNELSEAISQALGPITVAFTIITNPTKADVGDNNYTPPTVNRISDNNNIAIEESFVLPLNGWFTDIPFHQEFDLNLDMNKDAIYDYFKVAILCNNEMPLELDLSLVAIDHNNIEHLLFSEPVVIPASNGLKPGSSGFKAGSIPESNAAIRTISGNNVNLLLQAKKLKFAIQGEMPKLENGATMKFYSNSNLQLQLIGNLKGEI